MRPRGPGNEDVCCLATLGSNNLRFEENSGKLNNFTRNFAWKQQPSQIASILCSQVYKSLYVITFDCAALYFEKKATPFDSA